MDTIKNLSAKIRLLSTRVENLAEVARVNTTKIVVVGEVSRMVRQSQVDDKVKQKMYETLFLALDRNDPEFWEPLSKYKLGKCVSVFAKWAEDGTLQPPKRSRAKRSTLASKVKIA